jgi:hypothetical protein
MIMDMEMESISPDPIIALCNAFQSSRVLHSASELGVFTALADEPLDAAALARKIAIAERGARDFFDALVSLGLLERNEHGLYRNSEPSSHFLDQRKATYIGGLLAHANLRVYPQWTDLTRTLRMGGPETHDQPNFYQKLYCDPTKLEAFAKGMTGGSRLVANEIAERFPWHEFASMVDIGTAQGCLPIAIAAGHPRIICGGFDLPQVRDLFEGYAREHGLSEDRLRFHPGDFMSDPLPNADVIVMGRVLHNWDLPTKMLLLRKAHDALPRDGRIIIYERLIDDDRRSNSAALLASLNMLVMTDGGFDFTAADCIEWMQVAGFRDMQVEPLSGELSMVIGTK